MSVYDDAEIAAVAAVRLAAAEDGGTPRSAEMHQVVFEMFERYPDGGPSAMVAAMARWLAACFSVLADEQSKPLDQFIDEWEMHKLAQHVADEDGDDQ